MKLFSIVFLTVFYQVTFGQKASKIVFPPPVLGMEYPEFISACKLYAHKKELVYTRFIYEGVDEYWGLHAEKECNDINAYLDLPDNVSLKPEDAKQFKDVHEHYWKKYLIIDVIGTFNDLSVSGYGHLGSNNSKFTVKYVVDAFAVDKKTSKPNTVVHR